MNREKARKEVDRHPSEAQIKAENYKKGHLYVQGLDITIENPKGSYRRGKDRNGKEWKTLMNNDYGYFRRTVGKDGDAIDVFLGPNLRSQKVFPIDQFINGKFDETKVMLGFNDAESAKAAYLSNYEKDWKGFKYITEVPMNIFKKWLYDGYRQRKPFAKYAQLTESVILNEWNDESDANSIIYDIMEEYSPFNVFEEFMLDKRQGRTRKKWNVIPATQYRNFLIKMVQRNGVSNIPYNIVYKWFTQIIIQNTLELEYLTAIAGHDSYAPIDEFNDFFGKEVSDWGEMVDYLDEIGFYDWAILPDGSDAISDYGIKPLYNLIEEFRNDMSAEELLVLINRILDVWHHRGDLSSAFIEGGSSTLSAISAGVPSTTTLNEKINFGEILMGCRHKIYITESQLNTIKENKKEENMKITEQQLREMVSEAISNALKARLNEDMTDEGFKDFMKNLGTGIKQGYNSYRADRLANNPDANPGYGNWNQAQRIDFYNELVQRERNMIAQTNQIRARRLKLAKQLGINPQKGLNPISDKDVQSRSIQQRINDPWAISNMRQNQRDTNLKKAQVAEDAVEECNK